MEAPGTQLLDRAIRGDRDALVELLKRHGSAARRDLAGRIPQRWQAVLSEDDVMQQAYANAAAGIARFEATEEGAFAKWLTAIARRALNDALKGLEAEKRGGDRRRIQPRASDESFVDLWELLSNPGTTPSGQAARGEARTALERGIAQLPGVYARVVMMYDLEGRAVGEVAEALGRSPGAIYMLRSRAHEMLHQLMGRTSQFFSDSP